jgi:hypothetical protein
MKSIKSMPAISHAGLGGGSGLGGSGGSLANQRAMLQRSQSMALQKPQEQMKVMARKVPFMAFPGVGSQLGVFVRSFSRANLQRMGSRVQSHASLSKLSGAAYGSLDFGQSPLSAAPSLHRELSEATSEEDLESMQPGFTLALGMAVLTAVLGQQNFQLERNVEL